MQGGLLESLADGWMAGWKKKEEDGERLAGERKREEV